MCSVGRYFTQHCKLYSESTYVAIETVTSDFAGTFATYFLGIELCAKVNTIQISYLRLYIVLSIDLTA